MTKARRYVHQVIRRIRQVDLWKPLYEDEKRARITNAESYNGERWHWGKF